MQKELKKIVNTCDKYLNGKLALSDFESQFEDLFLGSELEEYVDDIFCELQTDIAYCVPLKSERTHENYISESELKLKIKGYLAMITEDKKAPTSS